MKKERPHLSHLGDKSPMWLFIKLKLTQSCRWLWPGHPNLRNGVRFTLFNKNTVPRKRSEGRICQRHEAHAKLGKTHFHKCYQVSYSQRPHGANNVIPAFQMEKTKSSRVAGVSTHSMDARGNWGQNQHLTDSGVQNLSTKPYRAKTQESIVTWTAFQKDHLSPQLDPPNPSGWHLFSQPQSLLYKVGIRCVRKVFKYWRILEASACHTLKCQSILFVYSYKIFLL